MMRLLLLRGLQLGEPTVMRPAYQVLRQLELPAALAATTHRHLRSRQHSTDAGSRPASSSTIFALSSGAGRAAVAVVRLSGPASGRLSAS